MSARTTLVLVVVLAVLCLGYWFMLEFEARTRRVATEAKRVFAFAAEDIRGIAIQRADEEATAGERSEDGPWRIVAPHSTIQPNQKLWNRVAENLAKLQNERIIEEKPEDLAKYGLDDPDLIVTATTAEDQETRMIFGATDPTQERRYAQVDGAKVFLVTGNAFFELNRSLDILRYRNLVTLSEEGITRLDFAWYWREPDEEGGEEETVSEKPAVGDESVAVVVEKAEDGLWRLVEPVQALADQEAVEALVKELQTARGRNYIDTPESLDDYGLNPPKSRIKVSTGADSAPETLYLGSFAESGGQGGLFAQRSAEPSVFVTDAHIISLLPAEPDSFREARLITRPARDIVSIHLRSEEGDILLEKDPDEGWRLVKPIASDTDQLAVSGFVNVLKELRGKDFFDEARPEFGLDDPRLTITLAFEGEDAPVTIALGANTPEDDRVYATQETGTITTIHELTLPGITKTAFDFRRKDLMKFLQAEARVVSLTFENVAYRFEKSSRGRWSITAPTGKALESQSDVELLLRAIRGAKALAIAAENVPDDLAPYGLDAPILTVSVTTAPAGDDGAERVVGPLRIGHVTEDNSQERFAVVAGRQEVVRVAQAIMDDAREALRGVRDE